MTREETEKLNYWISRAIKAEKQITKICEAFIAWSDSPGWAINNEGEEKIEWIEINEVINEAIKHIDRLTQ